MALVTRVGVGYSDYLVTGYQDLTKLALGTDKSNKLRKAEALNAEGFPIEIITESDLVQLLETSNSDSSGGIREAASV